MNKDFTFFFLLSDYNTSICLKAPHLYEARIREAPLYKPLLTYTTEPSPRPFKDLGRRLLVEDDSPPFLLATQYPA
jgi:hypothetical protein